VPSISGVNLNTEMILGFMLIAFLGAMIPGPNGLLIASKTIMHGAKGGFVTLAGTLFAFYVHGLFLIIGLSALLLSSSVAFTLVKWLGVVYLLYLGFSSIIQAIKMKHFTPINEIVHSENPASNFNLISLGFVTNVLNPKVSLFYLAVFPQFLGNASDILSTTLLLVTLQVLVVGSWFSFVVVLSCNFSYSNNIHVVKITKAAVGSLLIWFGSNLAKVRVGT